MIETGEEEGRENERGKGGTDREKRNRWDEEEKRKGERRERGKRRKRKGGRWWDGVKER